VDDTLWLEHNLFVCLLAWVLILIRTIIGTRALQNLDVHVMRWTTIPTILLKTQNLIFWQLTVYCRAWYDPTNQAGFPLSLYINRTTMTLPLRPRPLGHLHGYAHPPPFHTPHSIWPSVTHDCITRPRLLNSSPVAEWPSVNFINIVREAFSPFTLILLAHGIEQCFSTFWGSRHPLRPKKNLAAPQHAKKWLSEVP